MIRRRPLCVGPTPRRAAPAGPTPRRVNVKVTLVPSTVPGGGEHFQYASSCVINDVVALDAGTLGFYHSAHDQARIRHVLLTHTHIDHVASLPIFVENAYEGNTDPVTIHGSADVLDSLRRDLFNNRLWPDFIALSVNNPHPFLKVARFDAGQTIEVEGLQVTAVAVDHVVPTSAFLVRDSKSSIAYVTDTGPTEEVWRHINSLPDLKAVFLEATFPNNMAWLAAISKHLTPAQFAVEAAKLTRPARLLAIHLKARFQAQVAAELKALNLPHFELAQFGTAYTF
jgi:ribonuclease BN (tRNA processing enzyme)